MANFDTKFNPYVAMITKPTGKNELQAAADGMLDFFAQRDKNELKDMKMEDLEAKKRDEKKLAMFGSSDKTLGAFAREHGNFETASGVDAAHKIRIDRAKMRLNEKKVDAKANKKPKTSSDTYYAPSFNPRAFSAEDEKQTPAPEAQKKTVTVYKDGKPIVYTVEG